MNRNNRKLNFLTKLKLTYGIDTDADKINSEIKDLKSQEQQVTRKLESTSFNKKFVQQILDDINKINELSRKTILEGKAGDLSIEIFSRQFLIERAKKQGIDIDKIVDMQIKYQILIDDAVSKYIDGVINFSFDDNDIKYLIMNINSYLNRIKVPDIPLVISSYVDLDVIKTKLLTLCSKISISEKGYYDEIKKLQKTIYDIEVSDEKKMADYAVEVNRRKK